LKRIFNPIIENEFSENTGTGKQFNEVLNKRSIPSISLDVKNIDRHHSEWTNDLITFRTHNYNSYGSAQDFLKSVLARMSNKELPEIKTYYMARQFNQKLRNWAESKKNDKHYEGKTEIYNLDKRGFEELNLDVSLKMIFEIKGERIGDSFNWSITMRNKFGKKTPDDYSIKNGLENITLKNDGYLDDQLLLVTKSVQLEPGKLYSDIRTIMDDINVVETLRQVIHDFKSMISEIKPKSALKIANVTRSDVQRVDEQKIDKE
jgi:hypothetical protein